MNYITEEKKLLELYDIIICGGGMAGLSLAYRLSISTELQSKKILIIDKEPKIKNDRTWAFWEKGVNTFEPIIAKKWDSVYFINQQKQKNKLDLNGYQYKLIRGIDFYNFVYSEIGNRENIHFYYDELHSINDLGEFVEVTTSTKRFKSKFVFDSTYKLDLQNAKNHNVLQHFKGLVVETESEVFDAETPVMMDFSITQKNQECRFMYLLPFSKSKALLEFTLFSEQLLSDEEYMSELNDFIKDQLKIQNFKILEEEFGVIPMSDVGTQEKISKNIIRIGTSGGYTNPATGYTFSFTQKKISQIIKDLELHNRVNDSKSIWQKRHHLYASILLNVITEKRCLIADVFNDLYAKNPPSLIFKFLDNETTFLEELKIMSTTPIKHFAQAAIVVVFNRIFR